MITIITTDIKHLGSLQEARHVRGHVGLLGDCQHLNFAFSDSILKLILRFLSGIESYSSPCKEEKQRDPATKQGLRTHYFYSSSSEIRSKICVGV